ncbi:MAG: hypothetical protein M1831_002233 [Alyxoria varia]|nr:MAG: hypothetical protein M1831_002233 [Alyxoria varia]
MTPSALFRPTSRTVASNPPVLEGEETSRPKFRRITGYHNALEEQDPPDYDLHSATTPPSRTLAPLLRRTESDGDLPSYTCSIFAEGPVNMKVERTSPFDVVEHPFWTDVYLILRGPLLEVRHIKTKNLMNLYSKQNRSSDTPGRLIKAYTMQHAEIGLASDHKKIELVPKSLAQLLGPKALKQLQHTDPSQFEVIYNYVLRLRLEGEQVLFRFKTSDQRADWLNNLCAAVDIADPIEDRTEPRYHTLPRRRRRCNNAQTSQPQGNNSAVNAQGMVREQERIIQEQYPQLCASAQGHDPDPDNARGEMDEENNNETQDSEMQTTADPEAEDLDTSFVLPLVEGVNGGQMDVDISPLGLNRAGPDSDNDGNTFLRSSTGCKWTPSVTVDPSREARYRRRCMPMLVYNSRHANSVIVRNGQRVLIDWDNKTLVNYTTQPPNYADIGSSRFSSSNPAFQTIRALMQNPGSEPGVGQRGTRPNLKTMLTSIPSNDNTDNSSDDHSNTVPSPTQKEKGTWILRLRKFGRQKDCESTQPETVTTQTVSRGDENSGNRLRKTQSVDLSRITTSNSENERGMRQLGI